MNEESSQRIKSRLIIFDEEILESAGKNPTERQKKEEIAENHKPSAKIWNPVLVQQEGANKEVTARAGRV